MSSASSPRGRRRQSVRRGFAALTAAVALLAGCLDEAPPLECPRRPPSGGDPRGLWEVIDFCVEPPSAFVPQCPAIRLEHQGMSGTGLLDYRPDGKAAYNVRFITNAHFDGPLSCFPRARTCYDVGVEITKTERAEGSVVETFAFCRGRDHCSCAMKQVTHLTMVAGYQIIGNQIHEEGEDEPLDFTVSGRELRVQSSIFVGRAIRP